MNTLEKINRAKLSVAKEILDKMWEIVEYNRETNTMHTDDYVIDKLDDYIRTEHLFKSDYTSNK